MKNLKLNKLIIIFLIPILFLVSSPAKAEIRYDVEEMIIEDDGIRFKGWAIEANQNNYGGILTEILLKIETNTGKTITKSNYDPNQSGANATSAINAYKLDVNGEKKINDFYYIMCFNRTGSSGTCFEKFGTNQSITDGEHSGISTKCYYNNEGTNGYTSSSQIDCLYENINFDIKFTYDEINNLGITTDTTISLKLIIKYNDTKSIANATINTTYIGNKNNGFDNYKSLATSDTASIGVYSGNCKDNRNGTSKSCGNEIEVEDMKITLTKNNDTFKVNHYNTHIQKLNGTSLERMYPSITTTPTTSLHYWTHLESQSYKISGKTSSRLSLGSAYQYGYEIYGTGTNIKYADANDEAQWTTDANNITGYTFASWGGVSLGITIVVTPTKKCEPTNYNETLDINCNGTCTKDGDSSDSCNDANGLQKKFTTIPYSDTPCEHYFSVTSTDSTTGETVMASATVKFSQAGDITFNLPEGNQTILAGTSFHFSIVYHAILNWEYTSTISYSGATSNTTLKDKAKGALEAEIGSWFQYLQLNSTANSKVTINGIDGEEFQGEWVYSYSGGITKSASDTNYTILQSETTDYFIENKYIEVTAVYSLGKAVSDGNGGNVKYEHYPLADRLTSCMDQVPCETPSGALGLSRYFTPLSYSDPKVPITATIKGLSLLKGTNWQVNYECSVNLYGNYYNEGQFVFYYRPINTNNPFPLGKYTENWSSWINSVGGETAAKTIIADSYNKSNLEYVVKIDTETVKEIRNYNDDNNYLNSTINENGSSEYINNNDFFERITASNYYSTLGTCTNDQSKDTNNCYCPLKNADGSCAYIGDGGTQ